MHNWESYPCFAVRKIMYLAKKIVNLESKNAKKPQPESLFLKKWTSWIHSL